MTKAKKKTNKVTKPKEDLDPKYAKMQKAYGASAKIMKAKMAKERKEDLDLLDRAGDDHIIIVKGVYDKVELVMNAVGLEYIFLEEQAVGRVDFRPDQILIINCPGSGIDQQGIDDIRDFVKNGGYLVSTDWVLKNVLERAFPGYVEFNGHQTSDEVVAIQIKDKSHPFLKGMFSDVSKPVWWLEGSSYPIRILSEKAVEVLIRSDEMKKKYEDDPVVVSFDYGKGKVLHMLSHYYLQRSETRDERHKKKAKDYAKEMGLSEKDLDMKDLEGVQLGEVESAYGTAQFISNLIIEKQREVTDKEPEKKKKNRSV